MLRGDVEEGWRGGSLPGSGGVGIEASADMICGLAGQMGLLGMEEEKKIQVDAVWDARLARAFKAADKEPYRGHHVVYEYHTKFKSFLLSFVISQVKTFYPDIIK